MYLAGAESYFDWTYYESNFAKLLFQEDNWYSLLLIDSDFLNFLQ